MAKRTATPSEQSGLIPESSSSAVTASSVSFSASDSNSYRLAPGASLETSPPSSSHRITRSAARLAADSPSSTSRPASSSTVSPPQPPPPPPQARKRKVSTTTRPSRPSSDQAQLPPASPPRRAKRVKLTGSSSSDLSASVSQRRVGSRQQPPAMSQPSPPTRPSDDSSKTPASSSAAPRQRPSRNKNPSQDAPSTQTSPSRRQRKHRLSKRESDVTMKEPEENQQEEETPEAKETEASTSGDSNEGPHPSGMTDEEDGDPFRNGLFGTRSPMGLQNTLRALSGMMSGTSSRLRDILNNLRNTEDPSIQLIALQELSDLLLVSNEDNLAGQFSPDPFVKELVRLMQPSETGEENPEIMLLACRSLANMMEALRGSVANVVYGGAVPVLCQKLLDIQFIDLAEQALSTLAKISVDFPSSIVREGGLTACLSYLDFFPTSTQRTAVITAANCCRNLPHDSFPVIRDVMPTLLNVLSSNDQKVVEQGCLCVSRVVESFKYKPEKLEQLIKPDMLRAILRLLLPGTTNLIGPHIHTQFLRVLAITAKSSPRLSVELLKMNVVDTLYQILTGVSPPSETGGSIKIDSVHIMQALIHRPREQVFETLNVICELLPGVPNESLVVSDYNITANFESDIFPVSRTPRTKALAEQRVKRLKGCKTEIKRFATILLPTLTDAYSSTVNLSVRQKVLVAQLKMLQNLDAQIIEDALRTVPYASFLAAILSQKDHMSLVALALQCAELLFERLEDIYQYQFHREGVITEITKLAETPLSAEPKDSKREVDLENGRSSEKGDENSEDEEEKDHVMNHDEDSQEDEDDEDDEDNDEDNDDMSESESSSSVSGGPMSRNADSALQDFVTCSAKKFLRIYDGSKGKGMHDQALAILQSLQALVGEIEACYNNVKPIDGYVLFQKLAAYFDGDALESITSSELLSSGIIQVLLDVISKKDQVPGKDARTDFLRAFMESDISTETVSKVGSPTTPFSVLIHKLHDLLSRTEHYEVITVNHSSLDNRNATSMLSKQLRLRLIADEESDIPKPYKNMMVSIHAIANFKALDDYLRPRISLSERPRGSRNRDTIFSQLSGSSRSRDAAGSGTETALSGGLEQPNLPPPPPQQATSSRSTRVPERSKPQRSSSTRTPTSGGSDERSLRTRYPNRHQPPPPDDETDGTDEPLECADERQLTDDEEGEEEDDALDAIVDDLEDDLSDEEVADPTAVNLEVAATGKVTARKEDGTRVSTPQQSNQTGRPSSSAPTSGQSLGGSLAFAGRPFSYAAAIASIPQDWHIEFRVDDKPISHETTVYRAIHHNREHLSDCHARNVWSMVHTIKYKRVQGPPPPEPSTLTPNSSNLSLETDSSGMPESLSKNPTTASILKLLGLLHGMNAQLDDILAESNHQIRVVKEPLAQFLNTKLTAKLNRQLEEPLIVASSCLPSWSEDLARHFPFLFPFETRHLFLQSTSFGYARSMMRWQGSQSDENRRDQRRDDRPYAGRLQRQKVRISRSRILDSAMKVMELYGSSPSVLEVEYFEEVGTGLGPTLEFYSTVSKEFSKKKLKLWREHDSNDKNDYVFHKLGLFPAPMSREQASSEAGKKQLQYFKGLGKFVARSMLDSRIIDIAFNPIFFRIGGATSSTVTPTIATVKAVDPELANSLTLVKRFVTAQASINADDSLSAEEKARALDELTVDGVRVEDLGLDFTLPGHPSIQMIPHGSSIAVTMDNVGSYVSKVIDMTLGSGVQAQLDAFRAGFSQVFPYSSLQSFTPDELVMLFGQVEEDWSIETLMDSMKADHGFNMDSKSVRNLLQVMSEFTKQERRDFLQFVTGSPKLPIGGFKSLTPMFTVVCRPSDPPYLPDDYLPSVMTCVNYLKLPDYTNIDILRERLNVAMHEGQGAFHLS
ncbi:E3 ubiquitin-protein ligase TRIP12 [Blastomyces gilchristii SLH14081]|uniref:HECT-type E3 ubiquitin transferase n=1 Tax=Blastomyces gilchristii (strain SLH14081) TaxID=559298 RepID=A0A179UDA7_BLAGS|nr:E3 ubiquitin-protein ligase TRIP12 [Blastomyces gilchristii SLH14081]OAT05713.1 E3 ubiquitin-protein ligase TRIP12 [Blastomyces gilchristii SLH14081]